MIAVFVTNVSCNCIGNCHVKKHRLCDRIPRGRDVKTNVVNFFLLLQQLIYFLFYFAKYFYIKCLFTRPMTGTGLMSRKGRTKYGYDYFESSSNS